MKRSSSSHEDMNAEYQHLNGYGHHVVGNENTSPGSVDENTGESFADEYAYPMDQYAHADIIEGDSKPSAYYAEDVDHLRRNGGSAHEIAAAAVVHAENSIHQYSYEDSKPAANRSGEFLDDLKHLPPDQIYCNVGSINGFAEKSIDQYSYDNPKPAAGRSRDILDDANQVGHLPPTSKNIEQYLNSLDQRAKIASPPELDRKLPATNTDTFQQHSRGRQRRRSSIDQMPSSDVPLRFVHVPNNVASLDATKRTPSVPDLISYMHINNSQISFEEDASIPLLSETLRGKERQSRKEQFVKERLRLAHFRLNSDAESSVTRYRSKSTPSRGIWAHRIVNTESFERQSQGAEDYAVENGGATLIHEHLTQLEQADTGVSHTNGVHTLSSADPIESGLINDPPPAVIVTMNETTSGQHISPNTVAMLVNNVPANNSSVKSSDGSHRIRTYSAFSSERHAIPEPPPLPPPATEKERRVLREREARHETERARRRHLALLREREMGESADVAENEGSDHVDLLGQVSFDAGLQSAPEFVGDSALGLDLVVCSSSIGSSVGIPRPEPPPPPPLATERERLVERERQARLETERARIRRHLALQRERRMEEDDSNGSIPDVVDTLTFENQTNTQLDRVMAPLPATDEGGGDENSKAQSRTSTSMEYNNLTQAQTADAEASLSYPMERFIAEVERPSMLHVDPPAAESETASLPYTMELFLAENAVPTTNEGSVPENNEMTVDSVGSDDINANPTNFVDNIEPQTTSATLQLNLDPESNLVDELPGDPIEWSEPMNDLAGQSSVVSVIVSTNRGSLGDNEHVEINNSHVPASNSASVGEYLPEIPWAANTDSPQSLISNASPSHESFESDPHIPHLTEADIAQLSEVERASIRNSPPQSVRDDPSVPSILPDMNIGPFSVATQTTMIESVTEASYGRGERAFSDINESVESLNVVRIDSAGSIQAPTTTSGGASSASIEAMPSSDSSDESDSIDHPHSEGISDSLSHSIAPGSHPSSDNRMPRLTEADVVAMDEIDHTSICNAPPRSVRDERLSESSVTERSGRHYFDTISEGLSSVDEHIPTVSRLIPDTSRRDDILSSQRENASVEAMPSVHSNLTSVHSDHSIEVMPSEHDGDDSMRDSDEEMIVYQASDMGSIASVEAQPSIDINNIDDEVGLYNYGSVSEDNALLDLLTEVEYINDDDTEQDIESAPLLSARQAVQGQSSDSSRSKEKATPNGKQNAS